MSEIDDTLSTLGILFLPFAIVLGVIGWFIAGWKGALIGSILGYFLERFINGVLK